MTGAPMHSSASTSSMSRPSSRESLHEGTLSADAVHTRTRRPMVDGTLDMQSAPRDIRRSTEDSTLDIESARAAPIASAQSQGLPGSASVPSDEATSADAERDPEPPEREREREPQSTAVRVVVRFRPPMNTLDDSRESRTALRARRTEDGSGFVVHTEKNIVESSDLQHRFTFDRAFDQNLTQEECYIDVGMPIVSDVLQGYHGTILAYGQTGSGKTYCMFGTPSPPDKQGLVPRAAHQVFDHVGAGARAGIKFFIECTFFEVYCEQMRDLLKPGNGRLQIKEMPQKGFCVEGLTYKSVNSTNEVLQVLRAGLKQRAAGLTRLNQHSSRSHAIFTLHVQQHSATGTEKHGKLTLVDLAGSEKVHKSGSAGDMLEEAKKINSSLSTLGHVIDALADRRPHVPYRDSKLTRILEDSLGGNCRTTLLVTCSPNSVHSIETLSSLRFAARAKRVCNYVRVNVTYAADRQLFNRITQLRRELAKAHRELEQRFDERQKKQIIPLGDDKPDKAEKPEMKRASMSPSSRQRPLSPKRRPQDFNIDVFPHPHPRRSLDKSASASSIGSVPISRMPIVREAQATVGASREDADQNARTGTGASREDGNLSSKANEANLLSPKSPMRPGVLSASPEISPVSPFRSISDAASTAAASASAASSHVVHLGSTCDTPLSSSWDKWDMIDGSGSLCGRWDDDLTAAHHSRSASALPSCSVEAGSLTCQGPCLDDDDCVNLADVHSQEDLQFALEKERHRCAVLALELRNRTRESKDLRRQLEETQVYRQFQPLLVTLGIPCLPSHPYGSAPPSAAPIGGSFPTVGSMPVLPPMTPLVQEVRTCHDVAAPPNALHLSASVSQLHSASASQLHRAASGTPSVSSPHRQISSPISNEFVQGLSPQPQRPQAQPQRQLSSSMSTEQLSASISNRSPSPGSRVVVRYSTVRQATSPRHTRQPQCVTPVCAKLVSPSPRPSSTCRTQFRRSGSLSGSLQRTLHTPTRMVSRASTTGPAGSLTTRESTGNLNVPGVARQVSCPRTGSLTTRESTGNLNHSVARQVSRPGSLTARAGPPLTAGRARPATPASPASDVSSRSTPYHAGAVFAKSAPAPCAVPAPLQPPVPMVPGGAADRTLAELRSELQSWVNSSVSTGGPGQMP